MKRINTEKDLNTNKVQEEVTSKDLTLPNDSNQTVTVNTDKSSKLKNVSGENKKDRIKNEISNLRDSKQLG